MTSSNDHRRGRRPTTPSQSAAERLARSRGAHALPLEDADLPPSSHCSMPTPLDDYFDDLDGHTTKATPRRPTEAPRQSAMAPARQAAPPHNPAPVAAQVATKEPATSRDQLVMVHFTLMHEAQARMADAKAKADLEHIEHRFAAHRPLGGVGGYLPPLPPAQNISHWVLIGIIILASVLVIRTFAGGGDVLNLSKWSRIVSDGALANVQHGLSGLANPSGDYTLRAPPSITAQQIDRILAAYGSPAAGTGAIWENLGLKYGIDPAFAIAFFVHESAAGTAQAWAGLKSDGGTTHNVGNIICAGYATCYGRFRDYPSWAEGIEDWYRLIDVEYLKGRGHQTVADIVPVYAPSVENDVQSYINVVQTLVDQWRSQRAP